MSDKVIELYILKTQKINFYDEMNESGEVFSMRNDNDGWSSETESS